MKGLDQTPGRHDNEVMTNIDARHPQGDDLPTLIVYSKGEVIFSSKGRWLHPLFELEDFLARRDHDPAVLTLEDKIIGKAAALLIARLGIRSVRARLLSRLGQGVLDTRGISYTHELLVDRIDCATESILERVDDPEEAYEIVRLRAGLKGAPTWKS